MGNLEFVWVFNGVGGRFPGGVFASLKSAELWIKKHNLTGMLTQFPLDQGVFDWALENNMHNISDSKIEQKKKDPEFIGSFSSASQEHYHYENGVRD